MPSKPVQRQSGPASPARTAAASVDGKGIAQGGVGRQASRGSAPPQHRDGIARQQRQRPIRRRVVEAKGWSVGMSRTVGMPERSHSGAPRSVRARTSSRLRGGYCAGRA
jgi:hypothetical protein